MRLLDDDVFETSILLISSPLLTPTSTEFFESYLSPMQSPYLSIPNVLHLIQAVNRRLGGTNGFTQCPLCPRRHTRTFGPEALQQYLSSGFHSKMLPTTVIRSMPDEISFHCPLTLTKGSRARKPPIIFSTVSGLAQQVESGACYGGKETLRLAIKYLQSEMKTLDPGGLKLLNWSLDFHL